MSGIPSTLRFPQRCRLLRLRNLSPVSTLVFIASKTEMRVPNAPRFQIVVARTGHLPSDSKS